MACECQICKNNLPFDLPSEIIDASISGDLVVFAGAGISTESSAVFKQTLYEDVFTDLNLDDDKKLDFPSLMTLYCKQKNGRKLLLEKIHKRFEYCHQFKELYRIATDFHSELSSIYTIDKIITTNWDDYFERECNAIPIVTAEDFAFYNVEARKVFKLHGSISNYGSIIATSEDYTRCYKNLQTGIIGSFLKTILATKVVVFVGYSFSDFDFNKIYTYLKKEMGDILPHCYIVTLDKTFEEKFKKEKVTIINTAGKHFFSILRSHLEGIKVLIPKKNLENVELFSYLRSQVHKKSEEYFYKTRTTNGIYNLFYQDGMQHAFDYLNFHSKAGITFNSHHIQRHLRSYEEIKKMCLKAKNYPDYAYVEGYSVGLMSIFYDDPEEYFPFYFIMGVGPVRTFKDFSKYLRKQKVYHKTAEAVGKKYFKHMLDKKADIVPHHRAFIGE